MEVFPYTPVVHDMLWEYCCTKDKADKAIVTFLNLSVCTLSQGQQCDWSVSVQVRVQ